MDTDVILFEDRVKYDLWGKWLLALPVIFLIIFGILFLRNADTQTIFPSESRADSELAGIVFLASAIFVLLVYAAVMPRSLQVLSDRLRIRYGIFRWNIPFKDISSIKEARGIPPLLANSSVTAFGCQIEIVRKHKMAIRICPSRRDLFLETVNRALLDWQNARPSP